MASLFKAFRADLDDDDDDADDQEVAPPAQTQAGGGGSQTQSGSAGVKAGGATAAGNTASGGQARGAGGSGAANSTTGRGTSGAAGSGGGAAGSRSGGQPSGGGGGAGASGASGGAIGGNNGSNVNAKWTRELLIAVQISTNAAPAAPGSGPGSGFGSSSSSWTGLACHCGATATMAATAAGAGSMPGKKQPVCTMVGVFNHNWFPSWPFLRTSQQLNAQHAMVSETGVVTKLAAEGTRPYFFVAQVLQALTDTTALRRGKVAYRLMCLPSNAVELEFVSAVPELSVREYPKLPIGATVLVLNAEPHVFTNGVGRIGLRVSDITKLIVIPLSLEIVARIMCDFDYQLCQSCGSQLRDRRMTCPQCQIAQYCDEACIGADAHRHVLLCRCYAVLFRLTACCKLSVYHHIISDSAVCQLILGDNTMMEREYVETLRREKYLGTTVCPTPPAGAIDESQAAAPAPAPAPKAAPAPAPAPKAAAASKPAAAASKPAAAATKPAAAAPKPAPAAAPTPAPKTSSSGTVSVGPIQEVIGPDGTTMFGSMISMPNPAAAVPIRSVSESEAGPAPAPAPAPARAAAAPAAPAVPPPVRPPGGPRAPLPLAAPIPFTAGRKACQCGFDGLRGPVKCTMQGLRNHNQFPSFCHLEAAVSSSRSTRLPWCVFGEVARDGTLMTRVVYFVTGCVQDAPTMVALYPKDGVVPSRLAGVQVGHTLGILVPGRHQFLDGQAGIRAEYMDNLHVFPARLQELVTEADKLIAAKEATACFNCGLVAPLSSALSASGVAITEDTPRLDKCGNCLLALYCSRNCQAQHWVAMHKRLCPHMQKLSQVLDFVNRPTSEAKGWSRLSS